MDDKGSRVMNLGQCKGHVRWRSWLQGRLANQAEVPKVSFRTVGMWWERWGRNSETFPKWSPWDTMPTGMRGGKKGAGSDSWSPHQGLDGL